MAQGEKIFLTRTYFFYKVIRFFVRYFPVKFNYAVANLLSDIFYAFPTDIKINVNYNLNKIYGLKKESVDVNKKAKQVFRNFAGYLIDLVCLDVLPQEEINKFFLDIKGRENLDAVKNKGTIIVTLHMGNWELGGAFLTHNGYDFTAIYERHHDKNLNVFMNNIRLKHKFGVVDRRDFKTLIRAFNEKKNIAILGDIGYDSQTVMVDFLGVNYGLPAGPVVLALKYNIPIIPAVCIKSGSGYKILVSPLLTMEKTGNIKNDIQLNARKLAKVMEGFILKDPEQWFVFKRFDNNEK